MSIGSRVKTFGSVVRGAAKKAFGRVFTYDDTNLIGSPNVSGQLITSEVVDYIAKLSNFPQMNEEDIYEQLFIWDDGVGGAIDRAGTLAAECFHEPIIKTDTDLTDEEKECLEVAKGVWEKMRVKDVVEAMIEILTSQGNLFLDTRQKDAITILPNRYVSLIEDKTQFKNAGIMKVITAPKILVLYELPIDKYYYSQFITDYVHIKYKDTPVFQRDVMHRLTYGVYSPSPVHRAVLPIWWKRQTMIVDILLRWRNVPREHHTLDSSMFTMDKYSGTKEQRIAAAQVDAENAVNTYIEKLKKQAPDQGYVSLDTVKINPVGTGTKYTSPNELIDQLSGSVYNSLNMPESAVSGKNTASYASEVMISNYISTKSLSMAGKIKPVVLSVLKERVRLIKDSLPYEKLDIKMELSLAATTLEVFRQAAIMANLGCFTIDEIRDLLGYGVLPEDKKDQVVKGGTQVGSIANPGEGPLKSPQTERSQEQHNSDKGERIANVPQDVKLEKEPLVSDNLYPPPAEVDITEEKRLGNKKRRIKK